MGKACTPVTTLQKYCTFPISATPAVPNIAGGKGVRRNFLLLFVFFFLPMFSSFVFLSPSSVNNAQYSICLFFPPISFLGVEKAAFRSFPYLYRLYIFFVLKT